MMIQEACVLVAKSAPKGYSALRSRLCVPDACISSLSAQTGFRRALARQFAEAAKPGRDTLIMDLRAPLARAQAELAAKLLTQEIFRHLQNRRARRLKKIIIVVADAALRALVERIVTGYLTHLRDKICQGPFLTVDGLIEFGSGLVLIERKNPPLGWALPGGFVDRGETVEHAVAREVKEETGLKFSGIKYFKTCSDPKRDPRFHTVSIVFTGIGKGRLRAASDAKNVGVFCLDALPDRIAFDHEKIIKEYASAARGHGVRNQRK